VIVAVVGGQPPQYLERFAVHPVHDGTGLIQHQRLVGQLFDSNSLTDLQTHVRSTFGFRPAEDNNATQASHGDER
jgi:hypothetical protein